MSVEVQISVVDARLLTDRIKSTVEDVWKLIVAAYNTRAWVALDYASWDKYCISEFGTSRLRLPSEERQEVVASLRESGLSIRAIAAATGDSYGTVSRDLGSGDPNGSPDDDPPPIIGTDGKTYTPPKPPKPTPAPDIPDESDDVDLDADVSNSPEPEPEPEPKVKRKRRPITDQASDAGWELRKAVERIERLAADDRFKANTSKVALHLQGHLINAIDVCQDLLDRINATTSK